MSSNQTEKFFPASDIHKRNNHNQVFDLQHVLIYVGILIAFLVAISLFFCGRYYYNKRNKQPIYTRVVDDARSRQLTHKELLAQLQGASPMLDRIQHRRMKEAAHGGASYQNYHESYSVI